MHHMLFVIWPLYTNQLIESLFADESRQSFNEKLAKSIEGSAQGSTLSLNGMFISRRVLRPQLDEDAATIALIATKLRSNFLFLSLDDDAVIDLAQHFEEVEYDPGTTIIEQGSCYLCVPSLESIT